MTVRIVDRCPECQAGDIDLSAEAFARIAEPAAGRVPITWQVVAGDVQGPVSYRFKEGSTRFWTAIQVRNHRLPIAALAIRPAGGCRVDRGAACRLQLLRPPERDRAGWRCRSRVTAAGGAVLIDSLPEPVGGLATAGLAQFP